MAEVISLVEAVYTPSLNPKVVSIMQMSDGNWVGEHMKPNAEGKMVLVRVRGAHPVNVMQGILTHDGSPETLTV